MIHYQLRCGASHDFDGWFRDSAGFEDQARRGLLECPSCGDRRVARAMMAPALARTGKIQPGAAEIVAPPSLSQAVAVPAPPSQIAVAGEPLPAQLRAALQRMRSEVERHCDYVGAGFATEARRIHNGEADARGIYGEATAAEAEALADDGVTVSRIPWLPRADS